MALVLSLAEVMQMTFSSLWASVAQWGHDDTSLTPLQGVRGLNGEHSVCDAGRSAPRREGEALGVALCPTLAGQRGIDLSTRQTGRAFVHFRAGKQS